ncbi:MAG: MotA/TolQ/ExbB proton channel family protein [Oligoflexia bacterium]|nr:MotA/TolQ/ExbB proton channel family protein [Oligoflexia bacterium]
MSSNLNLTDILFNLFNLMGSEWVLWLLLVLSIISIGIVFERSRNLRRQEKVGNLLWKEKIDPWMKNGIIDHKPEEIQEIVLKYPCLESGLLEFLYNSPKKEKENLTLFMSSFLARKKIELDRHLSFLGTLGANSPFIGLFGTILGIIKAFYDIGNNVAGEGAKSISVGLSEALVATAVGLLVAIPAVIFFNLYQRKIKTIIARAESLGDYIIGIR